MSEWPIFFERISGVSPQMAKNSHVYKAGLFHTEISFCLINAGITGMYHNAQPMPNVKEKEKKHCEVLIKYI